MSLPSGSPRSLPLGQSPASRRTLLRGAAWTVPAVMAVSASPAFASSTGGTPGPLFSSVVSSDQLAISYPQATNFASYLTIEHRGDLLTRMTPGVDQSVGSFATSWAMPAGRLAALLSAMKWPATVMNVTQVFRWTSGGELIQGSRSAFAGARLTPEANGIDGSPVGFAFPPVASVAALAPGSRLDLEVGIVIFDLSPSGVVGTGGVTKGFQIRGTLEDYPWRTIHSVEILPVA